MENQNPWDTDNNSPNPHESSSTKSTSGESNSAINAKRYAALTGFAQPTNQSDESDTTEGTEAPESTLLETEESSSNPYQSRTFHSFSSHPIPKIILVFGTVLIAVLVAGVILNSGNFKQTANEEEPEPVAATTSHNDDTDSDTPELEKGELLTEIALAEQKQQLKALDSPQNRAKSTSKPSPSSYQPNSRPSPVVSPTPAPPPPQVI